MTHIHDINPDEVRVLGATEAETFPDHIATEPLFDEADAQRTEQSIGIALDRTTRFDANHHPDLGGSLPPASGTRAPTRNVSGWVHPSKKARERQPDKFGAARLRRQVVINHPNPPEAVLAARDEASAKIDAYDATIQAVLGLATDQANERRANEAAVADAIQAGTDVPALKHTDWYAEQMVRAARHEAAFRDAEAAVRAFKVTVSRSSEEWLANLLAELEGKHDEAAETIRAAAPVYRAWRDAVKAAAAFSIESGRFGNGWYASSDPLKSKLGMVDGYLDTLLAIAESDDDVISGDYLLTDDGKSPSLPMSTRRHLSKASESGAEWAAYILGVIEADENYQVSHFTPQDARPHYAKLIREHGFPDKLRHALASRRLNPATDI